MEDEEFRDTVGDDWFHNFSKSVISEVDRLGQLLYPGYFPNSEAYWKARRANGDSTDKLETKREWYPDFLILQTKINLLKLAKGKTVNQNILQAIIEKWEALLKVSTRAKRRHRFTVQKGWWKETEIEESIKTT